MDNVKAQRLSGASLVLLSSFFYGSYGVWSRLMGDDFGAYSQAALRALIVVGLLYLIGQPKRWKKLEWKSDYKWFIVLSLTAIFSQAPFYYAINKIGIGVATLTFYAAYLLTMFVFGWLFNKEIYTLVKFASSLLSVVGLWLVLSPSDLSVTLLPFSAAMLSGAAAAIGIGAGQKLRYSGVQTTYIAWMAGVFTLVPIALVVGGPVPSISDTGWIYLMLFAIVSVAASWSVMHGAKLIEAGLVGIIGLMEVVFGLLFGIIFFVERPEFLVYVGAICIILAASLPSLQDIKARRSLTVANR